MTSQQRNSNQENHDKWLRKQSVNDIRQLVDNLGNLMRQKDNLGVGNGSRLKANLSDSRKPLDAIDRAMQKHPGLTREEARAIVDAFGF